MTEQAKPGTPADNPQHDFDFLLGGQWKIENRRLTNPFKSPQKWETFQATQQVRPLPGGIGNYDDFSPIGWRPGFVGMSLRVLNPLTKLWSIFWLTNRDGGLDPTTGHLQAPVVGGFKGDQGTLLADDTLDGRAIKVRYEWTRLGPNHARWQQAFSADSGASWELNWVMEMRR